MNSLSKRIELVANIGIIIVALVICIALAKKFLFKSSASQPEVAAVAAGTKIALPDVNWARNGKTLLLVLSTNCKYCSLSAPFYQNLVNRTASPQGAKLIAVLPQGVEQSRQYLKGLNVSIDDVIQVPPPAFGVRVTPTLILVNDAGLVTDSWVGQLSVDQEAEVLAKLL